MRVDRVAVVDLWTDANRGDSALQLSLVKMLRDRYPGAEITGVFRFGWNEIEAAAPEISATSDVLDGVTGGARRTYYAAPNLARFSGAIHALVSLWSFLEMLGTILCYRLAPCAARTTFGRQRIAGIEAIACSDVVIWKGKNFRSYPGVTGVTRSMTLAAAGLAIGALNRSYYCVNASFWRIEQPVARWIHRAAFRRCCGITVRDRPSMPHARSLSSPTCDVDFAADLSFPILADLARSIDQQDQWDVAITVTSWGSAAEEDRYLHQLLDACDQFIGCGARRFVVVPQVTRAAEDNSHLVDRLVERLNSLPHAAAIAIEGRPTISELLEIYASSQVLLGTRMHSCVFARAAGTPFLAIAYDTGPKWDVLRQFWPAELILRYGDQPSEAARGAQVVWTQRQQLLTGSEEQWLRCIHSAGTNLDLLR